MKKRSVLGLEKRDELVDNLISNYISDNAEKITVLVGTPGSGKSYVLNKIVNNLKSKKLYTYLNCGNSFIQPNEHTSSLSLNDLSLSIGNAIVSLGAEIGIQNESTHQYNSIKRMLEVAKKHSVLICIDDFTNADSTIRSVYKIIISNIEKLESELSEKIYFLISDSSDNFAYNFIDEERYIEQITLNTYTSEDIIKYLEKNHLRLTINDTVRNNLSSIEKICNGNLSLVDFLFVDLTTQSNDFFDALEKIVDFRMLKIKESGQARNIPVVEMEDIILSSSLSLQRFSINEISSITQRDNNIVAAGLNIARENAFVDKDFECYYDFHCSEIKKILYQEGILKSKERLLSYYQYYTYYEPDEYYFRAYYLAVYWGKITSQSFSLLALALICETNLMDNVVINKIFTLIKSYGDTNLLVELKIIQNFYITISSDDSTPDYVFSKYKTIKKQGYELPLQAELTRACFYYLYRKCPPSDERTNLLLESCIQFARNPLCLSNFENSLNLKQIDEAIIRLSIIYTIAPYIIDVKNDTEQFDRMYKLSQSISKREVSNRSTGIAKYIENVFNRKAFLFVNQTQCDIFYEKAKSFFSKNQIWDELCITLICQAGTNIVIQQFEDAKEYCNQAINIASEHYIDIPQPAKVQNNLLIADFLETEKLGKSEKICINKAKQTIKKLKKQLANTPCATEYVILTNLCSLSLYVGDDVNYLKYKTKLQKLMHCNDVSDINDENIDDFYRYYFAWFEVFRMIQSKNWDQAQVIYSSLNGFVPSLFKKQEIFWEKKCQALANLIQDKVSISAYDFCLNLVKITNRENILSRFFFRGLMVSDLQYTSYI